MTTKDKEIDKTEINRRYVTLQKDLNIHVTQWERFCQQQHFFISVLKRPVKLTKDTYINASTADSLLLKRLNLSRHYGVKNISEVKSLYIDYIKNPLTAPKAEILAKFLVIIDQLRELRDRLNEAIREVLRQLGEDQTRNIDQGKVSVAHALNVEFKRLELLLKDENDFTGLDKEGFKLAIGDMLEFGGVVSLVPTIHDVVRGILKLISYYVNHPNNKPYRDEFEFLNMSQAKHSTSRKTASLPPIVHSATIPVAKADSYDQASQYYTNSDITPRSIDGSKSISRRKKSSALRSKEVDNNVGRPGNTVNDSNDPQLKNVEIRARKMAATMRKGHPNSAKTAPKPLEVTLPPIHEHGVLGNSTQDQNSRQPNNTDKDAHQRNTLDDKSEEWSELADSVDMRSLRSADTSSIQASVIEDLQRRVRSLEESSADMKIRQKLHILLSQGLSPTLTQETMQVIKDHICSEVIMVFGLAIGLTITDIATLRESHLNNDKEQVMQILLAWQRKQGAAGAMLDKVIEALVQIGQRDIANACLDDLRVLAMDSKTDRDQKT
ncbi:uncharacterized protein LOC144435720 [Glandiceps talaboti]